MDFTIKNVFKKEKNGRDIIVFQDSTKMAMLIAAEGEAIFSLKELEDYLTININARDNGYSFNKNFRLTYPVAMADHLVYSLGNENIEVEYKEEGDLGILTFSAGVPEWQVLISAAISGSDGEETMPEVEPNTTVTVGEDDQ